MNALQTLSALNSLHRAVGRALPEDQQLFVSANWPELAQWLATDLGKLALQSFVNDWQESKKPALRGLSNVKTR